MTDIPGSTQIGTGGEAEPTALANAETHDRAPEKSLPMATRAAAVGDKTETHFWLHRSDQLVVGVLVVAALLQMVCHWVRLSGWNRHPIEIERPVQY